MRLGEAMVKEGLITNDVLARALERQIIFGGRLGTNLVEMGAMSEEALAKFLSKSLGVPYAGPESFEEVGQDVIGSLPTELAQKYTAFPIKRERSRLHLAMKDPNDLPALDELRFITGLDIRAYIASELRIVYALEKYYGVKRDLRYISLLEDEKQAKHEPAPKPPAKSPAAAPAPPKAPEPFEYLGDESQEDIYTVPDQRSALGEEPGTVSIPEPVQEPKPAHAAPAAPKTPAPIQAQAAPPAHPAAAAPAAPPTAAPEKAAPANPYEALASPADREHVAESIVAAARQDLKRAALFLVKGSKVTGWKADGEGLDIGKALSSAIELSGPMVFREVVEEKSYYRGPVLKVPQNALLLEALMGEAPHEAIAYPLIIKGKVVGVLYGDNGKDSMITCDIQKLSGLMAKASMSLEILILKNKILN